MAEKYYLDRDDVLNKLHIAYELARIDQKAAVSTAIADINAIPAADVQPIRRGRWESIHAIWIGQEDVEGWFLQAQCTNCKKWAHKMNPYTREFEYDFCPHCKADMRGETKNEVR